MFDEYGADYILLQVRVLCVCVHMYIKDPQKYFLFVKPKHHQRRLLSS